MGQALEGEIVSTPGAGISAEDGPEAEWIAAARRGDGEAFGRLVRVRERAVYNLCLRMLGDSEAAADAAQETFLNAYRGLRTFRHGARFATWLHRIASNVCLTKLRRAPRPPMEAHIALDPPDPRAGPDRDLERRERRNRVRESMRLLVPDHRVVVELKVYQGRTFEEVSDMLGVPLSTVKTRFYAALQTMKHRLTSASAVSTGESRR